MQGFGEASFPQVFPVFRVFYRGSRHYRTCSGNPSLDGERLSVLKGRAATTARLPIFLNIWRYMDYRSKSGNDVRRAIGTQKPRKPLGFRGFGLQIRWS